MAPTAVSAESMTKSVPSRMALATSETSARVGMRFSVMLLFSKGVEVDLGVGGDFLEFLDSGAGIVGAVGAGGDGSGQGAFSDFAELVAVVGLDARGVAAGAVDVFGFDGGVVSPRPFLGDFGAKGVVVFLRGDEGVTLLTIQAAITEHVVSFAFD